VLVSIIATGVVGIPGFAWLVSRAPPKSDDQRRFEADYRTCIRSESPEDQLAACSRLIASGWLKERSLAMVYNNRGVAWWRLDRFDEALEDYERALSIDPDDPETHVNKGNAHAFRNEYYAALASYGQAAVIEPTHPLVHRNMGNALWAIGELEPALKSYDRAVALTPGERMPYDLRARLLMHMKRYEGAIADFDAMLRLDARDAQAIYGRGICWERLGQTAKAEADYARARRIDPRILDEERTRDLTRH